MDPIDWSRVNLPVLAVLAGKQNKNEEEVLAYQELLKLNRAISKRLRLLIIGENDDLIAEISE